MVECQYLLYDFIVLKEDPTIYMCKSRGLKFSVHVLDTYFSIGDDLSHYMV